MKLIPGPRERRIFETVHQSDKRRGATIGACLAFYRHVGESATAPRARRRAHSHTGIEPHRYPQNDAQSSPAPDDARAVGSDSIWGKVWGLDKRSCQNM